MGITQFSFSIAFIFLPGFIAYIILEKLTVHEEFKIFEKLVYSFCMGMVCYLVYFLIVEVLQNLFGLTYEIQAFNFLNIGTSASQNQNIINLSKYKYDVIWTSILSLPIALILTAIIQHNLLNKLGNILNVTQKFGYIDVWNYLTDYPEDIWVIVRDIRNDLMYYGYIEAYSDTSSNIEVFLRDVSVYKNISGVKLYDTDGLYIQRDRENLIIEFPKI